MSIILAIFGFITGVITMIILLTTKLICGVKLTIKGTGKIARVLFKVIRKA